MDTCISERGGTVATAVALSSASISLKVSFGDHDGGAFVDDGVGLMPRNGRFDGEDGADAGVADNVGVADSGAF